MNLSAELIVQNGRHGGARRKLTTPLTLVGSSAECDFCLADAGVGARHCVLAVTAAGLVVRDLNPAAATFRNGQKIASAVLHDGDVLGIGPYQIRVQCAEPAPAVADALRVQAAAVAAQQAALDEREAALAERQEAPPSRAMSAANPADIVPLSASSPGDLPEGAQRDLVLAQQKIQEERQRLATLYVRLRKRWHLHWRMRQTVIIQRRRQLDQLADSLARRAERLTQAEAALRRERLRQASAGLIGRQQLQEAWDELRRARARWQRRRGNERAALRVRAQELEAAALQLGKARMQLGRQQAGWKAQRLALATELDGLNQRIVNQRQLLPPPGCGTSEANPPDRQQDSSRACSGPAEEAPQRLIDLQTLAGDLADQHRMLVDAWQQLAQAHVQWQAERAAALAEVEAQAAHFLERSLALDSREHVNAQTEAVLRQRHHELVELHRHVVAWRARLRAEEAAFEQDKGGLLPQLRSKEALAEQQSAALRELRQRWLRRRQQEMQRLRHQRRSLEAFRREVVHLRQELVQRTARLEDERRILTEKALALEQHQHEALQGAVDQPEAQQRLVRLRRRWITQNADTIRDVQRQREALQSELAALEMRYEALHQRCVALEGAEEALTDKQVAWEQKQLLADARHTRVEHELRQAENQRLLAEQQCLALRDEVERIARGLLDEPDPPQQTPLAA
jgi:pSer/pThr/pTyr-binding forkhead associated (FHA) protein